MKESTQSLRAKQQALSKKITLLYRRVRNQIEIHRLGTGPLPPDAAYEELARLRDEYYDLKQQLQDRLSSRVAEDQERKKDRQAALSALKEVAGWQGKE